MDATPSKVRAWVSAARPQTLTASLAPVLVGSAFAWRDDVFQLPLALAALAGAMLIQVGTNLANDYYDYKRGADTPERVGPRRASATGALVPAHVKAAAATSFALACLVGLYLVVQAGWPILVVGLVSVAAGYAYTGGPYPLAYHGWGEAFVFTFFGLVAVGGTYFVQAGHVPLQVVAAGAAPGALSSAILVVNNLRDRATDERAGKITLAVRLGEAGSRLEYALLILVAFLVPMALFLAAPTLPLLLPLLSLPLAAGVIAGLAAAQTPQAVAPFLPKTSLLLLFHSVLLSVGVAWP